MLEIAKEDILSRLRFDNPWWDEKSDGKVAFEATPRRFYFAHFYRRIRDSKVRRAMVLMGPRRVGKTVMLYHAIRELLDSKVHPRAILYVSLETPIYTGLSLERLLGYFQEISGHKRDDNLYIFFDEIQYLKDWEVHLKSLVDSYPDYRFIATGSAAAALRLKSNESGAGRFSNFILPPLTFAEYLSFIGKEDELIEIIGKEDSHIEFDENEHGPTELLYPDRVDYLAKDIEKLNSEFVNYLSFGGYPEAVFSEEIRSNPGQYIKSDIIDKVLLRDLPSLYGISDIQELNRLFTTLAYNTGNEVSLEGLSKSSGVAKNTIKRYLEYLEAAFLISRIERIDQNAKRFKRALYFKVYLTNPSMRAALFGHVDPNAPAMGALTETAIFSQWAHNNFIDLYYARWSSGEVDIVFLDKANQSVYWAVEVKWSDKPSTYHSELENCVELVKHHPNIEPPFLVTSRTVRTDCTFKGVDFTFRPSSEYAYVLGKNILQAKS